MKTSRSYLLLAGLVLLFGVTWLLANRYWPREEITPAVTPSQLADLPSPSSVAVSSPSPSSAVTVTSTPTAKTSPTATASVPTSSSTGKVVLSVPFTVQAPDGDWNEPWQEGCEEAALLMVQAYLKGDKSETMPVQETKRAIQDMVNWQIGRFGSHRDISTAEMAVTAKEYLGLNAEVHNSQSIEDIKNALRAGKPVIIPAAGRALGNPYFTPPGPPYHVFVITGFDGDNFISNENGTRRGHDYLYSMKTIDGAWHDITPDDQPTGPRNFLTLSL